MEASAREYGLSFSFGANPEVFKRMSAFNAEVGERRFNSQVAGLAQARLLCESPTRESRPCSCVREQAPNQA